MTFERITGSGRRQSEDRPPSCPAHRARFCRGRRLQVDHERTSGILYVGCGLKAVLDALRVTASVARLFEEGPATDPIGAAADDSASHTSRCRRANHLHLGDQPLTREERASRLPWNSHTRTRSWKLRKRREAMPDEAAPPRIRRVKMSVELWATVAARARNDLHAAHHARPPQRSAVRRRLLAADGRYLEPKKPVRLPRAPLQPVRPRTSRPGHTPRSLPARYRRRAGSSR